MCFKAGILISLAFLLMILASLWLIIPFCSEVSSQASRRPQTVLASLTGLLTEPNPYIPPAAMAVSALYSFVALLLIYQYFEKTQSPEILFVAFFVFSFSLEGMRSAAPLQKLFGLPGPYVLVASRLLLFGRYFGIFSLFAASVCAAGLEVQKQRNIIFITAVATLIIALGVPIDILSWDSSFSMISGYTNMFRMVETGVFLITIVSFLIAAYSRGSREFVFVSLGAFLAFMGRVLLINADSWPGLTGIVFLTAGTCLICLRLHSVYLWL